MFNIKFTKNKTFVLAFFILTFISIFLLLGNSLNFKYYFHQDNVDSFMDLYNSVIAEKYSSKGSIVQGFYPPLSIVPYRIMGYGVNDINSALPLRQQAFDLRNSVYGTFLMLVHVMLFLFSLFIIGFYAIKGNDRKKIFYSLLLSFSGLVLSSLERGNIIVYAFLFTILFVLLYQSENEKHKYIAYICLAIAANLKLYPAVFGLLLIDNKDWSGIIKCAVFFFLIYFISFLFCGFVFSKSEVSMANENLYIYASFDLFKPIFDVFRAAVFNVVNGFSWGERTSDYGSGLNFSIINLCKIGYLFILKLTHINMENADIVKLYYVNHIIIYRIFTFLCFIMGLFSFFFVNEKWKKLAIPAFLCFFIPPTSWMYVLIFLIIPFIEFINTDQKSFFDNIYAVIFALVFAIVIIPVKIPLSPYAVTGAFALQAGALVFMYFCIFISAVKNIVLNKNR